MSVPRCLPVLYSFRRCPYAMRARLAIAISGDACELREVVLRNKPQELLEASPKATVPVLVDIDGRVLEQSLDIMLWALRKNDPAAWLAPDEQGLDGILALIAQCDEHFKYHLDRYKYPQRFADARGKAHHRAEGGLWLSGLEERLNEKPFLFGGHASLADMAIAPFVRQFAHTGPDWFQAQPWPKLHAWLHAWMESELFNRAMQKYAPWASEKAGVPFPG